MAHFFLRPFKSSLPVVTSIGMHLHPLPRFLEEIKLFTFCFFALFYIADNIIGTKPIARKTKFLFIPFLTPIDMQVISGSSFLYAKENCCWVNIWEFQSDVQ